MTEPVETRIALMRHFKVGIERPRTCNSREYDGACMEYDRRDIIIPAQPPELSTRYGVCYSSSMKRAVDTARLVYDGEIIYRDDIVEIPLRAIFSTRLKLPFGVWNVINRIGWARNSKRVAETRNQTMERVDRFLEHLFQCGHRDILVVSHGLFLAALQIELSRRGFKGNGFFRAGYGEVYEFSNRGR